MSLKVITIRASRTINILNKISKGGLIKRLKYIFKLFKFKLERGKDFIIIIINSKIAYILITNNINYNIVVLHH